MIVFLQDNYLNQKIYVLADMLWISIVIKVTTANSFEIENHEKYVQNCFVELLTWLPMHDQIHKQSSLVLHAKAEQQR